MLLSCWHPEEVFFNVKQFEIRVMGLKSAGKDVPDNCEGNISILQSKTPACAEFVPLLNIYDLSLAISKVVNMIVSFVNMVSRVTTGTQISIILDLG